MTLTAMTSERLLAAGLDPEDTERAVRCALDEDLRYGPDLTSAATAAPEARAVAGIVARESGVLAGVPVVLAVLDAAGIPPGAAEPLSADGDRIDGGAEVLRIRAPLRELLGAERTLLNFLTHLSGIATATRAWADALSGTRCAVRDTRKTTPGLRQLEKYAVRCGGGLNHRLGLGDAALIKDNHVMAAGGITAAIAAVRAAAPGLPLEVECDTLTQLREALDAGAGLILLDNMGLADLRAAVASRAGTLRPGWKPAEGCGWRWPGPWRRRASITLPSALSPIQVARSTWAWTYRSAETLEEILTPSCGAEPAP